MEQRHLASIETIVRGQDNLDRMKNEIRTVLQLLTGLIRDDIFARLEQGPRLWIGDDRVTWELTLSGRTCLGVSVKLGPRLVYEGKIHLLVGITPPLVEPMWRALPAFAKDLETQFPQLASKLDSVRGAAQITF